MKTLITAVILATVSATSVMAEPVFLPGVPTPITRVHQMQCTISSHMLNTSSYDDTGTRHLTTEYLPINHADIIINVISVNAIPTGLDLISVPELSGTYLGIDDLTIKHYKAPAWWIGVKTQQAASLTLYLGKDQHNAVWKKVSETEVIVPSGNPLDTSTTTHTVGVNEGWNWSDCTITEVEG